LLPRSQSRVLAENVNVVNVPPPVRQYATDPKTGITYGIITPKPALVAAVKSWKAALNAEMKARGPKPLTPEEEREMFMPSLEEQLGFNDQPDEYRAFRVSPICKIFLTVS